MQVYSASSVSSIFAKDTSSHDENRASAANGVTRTSTMGTPPQPNRRVCRSPFVTPDHPLYVFGEVSEPPPPPVRTRPFVEKKLPPPKKGRTCLESIREMSLSPDVSSPSSPFQRLVLSHAFTEEEKQPHREQQHQVLRKSVTFGMERIREMSVDPSLQDCVRIINGEVLEGADLGRRLRRMKRRLFLDAVVMPLGSSQHEDEKQDIADPRKLFPCIDKEETPRHSNRSLPSVSSTEDCPLGTMEGMEVVLEDMSRDDVLSASALNNTDSNYLLFSSSSLSIMNDEDDEVKPVSTTGAGRGEKVALSKPLSSDSSVATETTAACSTCGLDDHEQSDDDPHWVSLSSISENY